MKYGANIVSRLQYVSMKSLQYRHLSTIPTILHWQDLEELSYKSAELPWQEILW